MDKRRLELGGLLNATFEIVRRYKVTVLAWFAVFVALESGFGAFLEFVVWSDFNFGMEETLDFGWAFWLPLIAYMLVYWFLIVMACRSLLAVGKSDFVAERLPDGSRVLVAFFAYFVATLALYIGLLFLIVPGVFALVRWAFVIPYALDRQVNLNEALSQSSNLAKGSGWPILIAYVLFVVPTLVASFAISDLASRGEVWLLISTVGSAVLNSISTILTISMSIAAYRELMPDKAELSEVFT